MGKRTIRFVAALRLLSITIQGDLSTTAGGVRFDKIARFETGKRLLSCWNWMQQGGMPTPHVAPDLLGAADAKCAGVTPSDASDRKLRAVLDFTPNIARRSALPNRSRCAGYTRLGSPKRGRYRSELRKPVDGAAIMHQQRIIQPIQSLLME